MALVGAVVALVLAISALKPDERALPEVRCGLLLTSSRVPGRDTDTVYVQGALPGRASAARLRRANGEAEAITLESGGFAVSGTDAVALEWRDEAGAKRVALPLPN